VLEISTSPSQAPKGELGTEVGEKKNRSYVFKRIRKSYKEDKEKKTKGIRGFF